MPHELYWGTVYGRSYTRSVLTVPASWGQYSPARPSRLDSKMEKPRISVLPCNILCLFYVFCMVIMLNVYFALYSQVQNGADGMLLLESKSRITLSEPRL